MAQVREEVDLFVDGRISNPAADLMLLTIKNFQESKVMTEE